MGRQWRASDVAGAARHARQVELVALGHAAPATAARVVTSWQRCINEYGMESGGDRAPEILASSRLNELRDPVEPLIVGAQEEIDRLYGLVRDAGYTLLLCNMDGVAIAHRGNEADAGAFKHWGVWLGGVWSEDSEGTNGIGTCIAEQRPITVHRDQHFRARHINLSCSGAPIFGAEGRMIAVLDVSSIDPRLSDQAHALTGPLTIETARAIEEKFFREQFRRAWIVAIRTPEQSAAATLLAVDDDQRIIGANRAARAALSLDDGVLDEGVGLWTRFERDQALFRRSAEAEIATRLVLATNGNSCPAAVTSPKRVAAEPLGPAARTPELGDQRYPADFVPAPQVRGGLPPGALRRVLAHVDSNLAAQINVTTLAATAGVSVSHFIRAFKRSSGETPHCYLVRKRVEHARVMLANTDLALVDIAQAAGFSDQSHMARHFRRLIGLSPAEFRRSQR